MTNATIATAMTGVRFFTPTQSLKEQKQIFNELVRTARPNGPANVHLVTPQLAAWLLDERNGGNRRAAHKAIDLYADAMDDNDWSVTGATIVIGRSGRVLDGQHRLMACVRSDTPFMTYIVFGVDDAAFTRIDTGRRRSNIDAFTISGVAHSNVAAKAARWLKIFDGDPLNRSVTYTNQELLEYYKTELDHGRFDRCIALARDVEKATRSMPVGAMPAGSLAALFYFMDMKSRPDMEEFAGILKAGNKQPAKAIYANIHQAKEQSGGRINEVYRNAVVVKGWNAFRAGRSVTRASLSHSMGDEFPDFE